MESRKRKILIHSLVFSPDGVSTAYLYNDIALALKNVGYDVVVLSTTPHFNKLKNLSEKQQLKWGCWGLFKQSVFNGIPVYHVPQKKFKSSVLRLAGFIYWHIVSFFYGFGFFRQESVSWYVCCMGLFKFRLQYIDNFVQGRLFDTGPRYTRA